MHTSIRLGHISTGSAKDWNRVSCPEERLMRDMDELFAAFGRSKFRSRFRLPGEEAAYLRQKGLTTILEHGRGFVTRRLAGANPTNDGRQTPMKNQPAFIAQHATGTCCRKCLEKWHGIPKGKSLTKKQADRLHCRSYHTVAHQLIADLQDSCNFKI
ncbi:MAG: DUF4186 domain-containing protein [Phycisphaerae bacterium]